MQAATDGLFRVQSKSVVKLRCSISFAALILAPLLREFSRLHPEIDVELSTAVWSDRIDGTSFDLDIRYGEGDWPEQASHPIPVADATLMCHPEYAGNFGAEPTAEALAQADIVQIVGSETDWDRLFDQCGFEGPRPDYWIKADSSLIAMQILSAGHGCAILSRSFARRELAEGRLVDLFGLSLPMAANFVLVERDDLRGRKDVQTLVDWLLIQKI